MSEMNQRKERKHFAVTLLHNWSKKTKKTVLALRNISRIFLLRSWEAMVGNRRRLSCGTNTKDYRDVVETL